MGQPGIRRHDGFTGVPLDLKLQQDHTNRLHSRQRGQILLQPFAVSCSLSLVYQINLLQPDYTYWLQPMARESNSDTIIFCEQLQSGPRLSELVAVILKHKQLMARESSLAVTLCGSTQKSDYAYRLQLKVRESNSVATLCDQLQAGRSS